eukprot:757348-Hanusia_phi.AAC.4
MAGVVFVRDLVQRPLARRGPQHLVAGNSLQVGVEAELGGEGMTDVQVRPLRLLGGALPAGGDVVRGQDQPLRARAGADGAVSLPPSALREEGRTQGYQRGQLSPAVRGGSLQEMALRLLRKTLCPHGARGERGARGHTKKSRQQGRGHD